jgi:hypothetical protein
MNSSHPRNLWIRCGDDESESSATEQKLEVVQDLRHIQNCGELSHPSTDPVDVEIGLHLDDSGDVRDILRTSRQRFHDDEILGGRNADLDASGVDPLRPLDHFPLERECTQRQIDVHAGMVFHQKNAGPAREAQSIRDPWFETMPGSRDDQRLRVSLEDDDIDVLGQSRLPLQTRGHTSDHRCLEPLGLNPLHQIIERFTKMIDH